MICASKAQTTPFQIITWNFQFLNGKILSGNHRELQEAEVVPDVLVPWLRQDQEENVVRKLFWDTEEILGENNFNFNFNKTQIMFSLL